MNINASIVDQRLSGLIESHPEWFPWPRDPNKRKSAAFVVLCMSTALNLDMEDCADLLTEGGNDAGVDGIHLGEVEDGSFVVTLFQGKYRVNDLSGEANFPENGVKAALQTIEVLFDPYREVELNPKLQPRVAEVRSLIRDGDIPTVRVLLCNNGARWQPQADRWVTEAKTLYGDQVDIEHFSHDDIIRALQRRPHIDETVTLSGELIAEDLQFKRVIVGRIAVQELHRLYQQHGDALLERNIRRYLGPANRVNAEMRQTLLDAEKAPSFYFYNNGITAICDRLDFNALQKADHQVQLKNLQIVNGGQTCRTIYQALEEDLFAPTNAFVLIRIYQLSEDSREVVRDITRATNSQSPVDLRDLHANDDIQKTLALGIEQLGYVYKHHREDGVSGENVITSATVAEAALAVWRERPHQARLRRSQHFGKLYDTIFQGLEPAAALTAVLIYRDVERRRKDAPDDAPDYLPYASHHLAMLMGREILASLGLHKHNFSHRHFDAANQAQQTEGDLYYARAKTAIEDAIRDCYGDRPVSLQQLAATFRRGDLLEMLPPIA